MICHPNTREKKFVDLCLDWKKLDFKNIVDHLDHWGIHWFAQVKVCELRTPKSHFKSLLMAGGGDHLPLQKAVVLMGRWSPEWHWQWRKGSPVLSLHFDSPVFYSIHICNLPVIWKKMKGFLDGSISFW